MDQTIQTETLPPRYALKLISVGADRLRLLFEIRAARADLSLIAARALADGAPSIIKRELLREDVDRMCSHFATFAEVEVIQSDGEPLPQRLYETFPAKSTSGSIDG